MVPFNSNESSDDWGEEITNLDEVDNNVVVTSAIFGRRTRDNKKNDSAPMNESDWTFSKSFLY
jgi:hypothetical protein